MYFELLNTLREAQVYISRKAQMRSVVINSLLNKLIQPYTMHGNNTSIGQLLRMATKPLNISCKTFGGMLVSYQWLDRDSFAVLPISLIVLIVLYLQDIYVYQLTL